MPRRIRQERPAENPATGCASKPDPNRRTFLKFLGVGGAATILPTAPALASSAHEELASKHAADPSLLIDISKCTGCGSCAAACKLRKGLPWRDDQPTVGPKADLASTNLTTLKAFEVTSNGKKVTRFVKQQCFHCMKPGCASACFAKALKKSKKGPVSYDASMCVGCRYCMIACPFQVLTYEWDGVVKPRVKKCNLCEDITAQGYTPSCAAACPSGAITYGKRGAMLAEAHRRITAEPAKYQPTVYGEKEAGGTSVLYISDVPFKKVGFRQNAPDEPIPEIAETLAKPVPIVAVVVGGALTALHFANKRKEASEGGASK